VKTKKMPSLQQVGTATMADEFLALLLELDALNQDRLKQYGEEIRATSRRSHIPNKMS
jgi:hypothetical protein